jgi:hypothetical protein
MDYDFRLNMWKEVTEVKEWLETASAIESMPFGENKFAAYREHSELKMELLHQHPEPTLPMFIPTLSDTDDKEIATYNRDIKYEKADSDSILAVFKSTLSPTITTELTSTWNSTSIPSAQKARATWDFIKQYRTMNSDAVVTQLKLDITKLPSVANIQGAQHLYKQMAALQLQLITVGSKHAYAEDELVSLLKGKMVGENFINFKFILRTREQITTVPTLRLNPLTAIPANSDKRISWQELGQSLQMAVEEEVTHSYASSMLSSAEESAAFASQLLPAHSHYPTGTHSLGQRSAKPVIDPRHRQFPVDRQPTRAQSHPHYPPPPPPPYQRQPSAPTNPYPPCWITRG